MTSTTKNPAIRPAKTVPLRLFHDAADKVSADAPYRRWMQGALAGYAKTRAGTQGKFADWQSARRAAAAAKWEAIEHLDQHLATFADNLEKNGVTVHFAADADDARRYVLGVCERRGAKRIVKSKTMTSEEIGLNDALDAAGYETLESDLGEYIVQLRGEAPYHFVFPSMHLRRGEIQELFREKLGSETTDDPEALTMVARAVMRKAYLEADVGITGANFGVADLGAVSITENEGNARLTSSMPKCHISLMGIEKVIPSMDDLALLLPMLAVAGTGQHLTCYNSLLSGPRRDGENDGPEEMHVVLIDNGRTRLLADPEQRDALRCIRCGACLNVCPVFKNVGGHTYGTTYQGPIGSVITPHYQGLQEWKHLSHASSLCGACTETCPVKIDLHHHLLRNRRNAAAVKPGRAERATFRLFARVMTSPRLYRLAGRLSAVGDRLARPVAGTRLDPLRHWRKSRSLPSPAKQSFADWWEKEGKSQ